MTRVGIVFEGSQRESAERVRKLLPDYEIRLIARDYPVADSLAAWVVDLSAHFDAAFVLISSSPASRWVVRELAVDAERAGTQRLCPVILHGAVLPDFWPSELTSLSIDHLASAELESFLRGSNQDLWAASDRQSPATLEMMIRRLEERTTQPAFAALRNRYLDALAPDLKRATRVLDLGCGTGAVGRAILERGFEGRITGVDQCPALIEAAQAKAKEKGFGDRLELAVGDAHALSFPDATFDVVIADTLFSHLRRPNRVLREIARVAKSDASILIFDGDYASIGLGTWDAALAERIERAIYHSFVQQPRIMRTLPKRLKEVGLELQSVKGEVSLEAGHGLFWLGMAETYGPAAVRLDVISAFDAERWLAELKQDSAADAFFGACNYYTYRATAPSSRR